MVFTESVQTREPKIHPQTGVGGEGACFDFVASIWLFVWWWENLCKKLTFCWRSASLNTSRWSINLDVTAKLQIQWPGSAVQPIQAKLHGRGVDRPTQLICISDINIVFIILILYFWYSLPAMSTDKYKRHTGQITWERCSTNLISFDCRLKRWLTIGGQLGGESAKMISWNY